MACNYLLNIARKQKPVALFSLEMSQEEVFMVLNSIISGIPTERMISGNISNEDIALFASATDELNKLPIFVYDNRRTISEILTSSRYLKRKYDIKLIAVDYIQLVDSGLGKSSRNHQVEFVSRSLKLLAGSSDCDCTVLGLSQLSRQLEQRPDKRPMMSDLRESGAIEQDADLIQFLYRESYYDKSDNPTAELLIAKNRFGPTGRFYREVKNRVYHEVIQQELTQFPVKEFKI